MNGKKIGIIIGGSVIVCLLALAFFFSSRNISNIYEMRIKKIRFALYQKMYARALCMDKNFRCVTVEKDIAWEKFWPDARECELIMKLNRVNVPLKSGMPVAIPNDLKKSLMDFAPYPRKVPAIGEKFVIFDPAILAWAAYEKDGSLVRWGPALGGKDYCPDIRRACRTVVGNFKVITLGNEHSRSGRYPIEKNKPRARTPWVMYFYKHLYGIHGSDMMVGLHASHGCVRTFTDDAKWLNQNFVSIGTKVIVRPYPKKTK